MQQRGSTHRGEVSRCSQYCLAGMWQINWGRERKNNLASCPWAGGMMVGLCPDSQGWCPDVPHHSLTARELSHVPSGK